MNKTYVFAGASSKVAIESARLLKEQGHKIIGISTKEIDAPYDVCFKVSSYDFGTYPVIEEKIDGLAYFPGTINLKPFHRLTREDFMNDYAINSLGAVAFVQSYLNPLKKSEQGALVFMSTVASSTGMTFHSSIAMAKSALEGLTKSLAAELAPSIRVNCIAPSLLDTPLGEKFINTPEKLEASQKRNPLKKVGTALDLAKAVNFLLTDQSSWITGQVLAVDGGMNHLK